MKEMPRCPGDLCSGPSSPQSEDEGNSTSEQVSLAASPEQHLGPSWTA